jgi:hypothetical protein
MDQHTICASTHSIPILHFVSALKKDEIGEIDLTGLEATLLSLKLRKAAVTDGNDFASFQIQLILISLDNILQNLSNNLLEDFECKITEIAAEGSEYGVFLINLESLS